MPAQGKAMVFGATGFTGREVVRELIVRKIPAIAHIRPDSGRLQEWQKRFKKMGAKVDSRLRAEGLMAWKR